MNCEVISAPVTVRLELSAQEARDLYASLYHMTIEIDDYTAGKRKGHPWALPLFDLYDALYAKGFSE